MTADKGENNHKKSEAEKAKEPVNSNPSQITVTTLGFLLKKLDSKSSLDLSHLKQIVIDEADHFFSGDREYDEMKKLHNYLNDGKEPYY